MPKKSVVQYTCERCARVWYLDSSAPEPSAKIVLAAHGLKDTADVHYECLCDGCTETVTSLVKSLAPLKPREKRAKKKDEANSGASGQGNSPAANPSSATDGAPSLPAASPSAAPAPSLAGASSGAGGQQVSPSGGVRPSHPAPKR